MTAANADKWIPVRPGWEGYLALSIAQVIVAENLQAPALTWRSCWATLRQAQEPDARCSTPSAPKWRRPSSASPRR